jgi:hypothetical protein
MNVKMHLQPNEQAMIPVQPQSAKAHGIGGCSGEQGGTTVQKPILIS